MLVSTHHRNNQGDEPNGSTRNSETRNQRAINRNNTSVRQLDGESGTRSSGIPNKRADESINSSDERTTANVYTRACESTTIHRHELA